MAKIVCATSVLLGREAFASLGKLDWIPEKDIGPEVVRNADLLIARSKVKVNQALLHNSHVSFVATATAGFDHFDTAYLNKHGIAWTSSPGCNANSVAEWVIAALLHLAMQHGVDLQGRTLGIVGVGNVGSRVAALAPALGLRVLLNDPPRERAEPNLDWKSLDTILKESDIVTLHVPLTDGGPCPTRAMVDCRFLANLKPGAIFINASRGEVVDEESLLLSLERHYIGPAALDVFAHEPDVSPQTAARAAIATPHIAGYSYEGRLRGTEMCYQAACRFLEAEPQWTPPPLPPDPARVISYTAPRSSPIEALAHIVGAAYSIADDDRALRTGLTPDESARRRHFQQLRAHYPDRHEFPAFTVRLGGESADLARRLSRLGFGIKLL
ncbi:MAG: 4-phosphoerythronate dehydrogenase [Kiritimatiellae bacterium]|nr:4-phosphoerythronate dehydrogenase [Kiritimatiellia bacterium]